MCVRFLEVAALGSGTGGATVQSIDGGDTDVLSKERNNLLLFICYLYVFNTVFHGLVFDVIDKLVERFSEVESCCAGPLALAVAVCALFVGPVCCDCV